MLLEIHRKTLQDTASVVAGFQYLEIPGQRIASCASPIDRQPRSSCGLKGITLGVLVIPHSKAGSRGPGKICVPEVSVLNGECDGVGGVAGSECRIGERKQILSPTSDVVSRLTVHG